MNLFLGSFYCMVMESVTLLDFVVGYIFCAKQGKADPSQIVSVV